MKSKKIIALALILLIAAQCALYALAGYAKQYLHPDEALSLGLAQYHSANIQDNHDFFGTWHKGNYYKDYLIVNQDEVNNTQSVHENQVKNGNAPLYYFFLKFYMEFSVGSFSMMTSIVLNVMLYTLITLIIFFISKSLFEGKENKLWLAFGVTAASTFTLSTLSAVLNIGVYTMNTLFITAIIMLHVFQNEEGRPKFFIGVFSGVTVFLGILTHYSFIVILIALYLMFLIRYIVAKSWKNIIWYTLPILVGAGGALYVYPESLGHIADTLKLSELIPALSNGKGALKHAKQYLSEINKYTFHTALYIIAAIIALALIVAIIKSIVSKKNKAENEENEEKPKLLSNVITVLVPTLAFFLFYSFSTLKAELRNIYPICGLMFILLAVLLVRISSRAFGKIGATALICAVIAVMVVVPVVKNMEPETMYSNRVHVVNYAESHKDIPVIYVYDSACDNLRDDLYLLTKFEKSYITKDWQINSHNITNVFRKQDTSGGVIVIINDAQEHHTVLNTIMKTLKLSELSVVERLQSANVYYLFNNSDTVVVK